MPKPRPKPKTRLTKDETLRSSSYTRLKQQFNKAILELEKLKREYAAVEELAVKKIVSGLKPLSATKILAVEGKDEVSFFDKFFEHLGITDCEVVDVIGKSQFKATITALLLRPGFTDNVTTFGLIRDADEDAESAFTSLHDLIQNQQLIPPNQDNEFASGTPKVGIFIMPGNLDTGMLEDLCLKIVENHPIMPCVDTLFDCVSNSNVEQPKNISKAKVQAFLSTLPNLPRSIGEGAKQGCWDFKSPVLSDLKLFLENFR